MPKVTDGTKMRRTAMHRVKVIDLPSADNLIEISDLEKRFAAISGEPVTALTSVNLSAANGEFISIVGPSGCG
jgi:ABC-type glutathione transport system ATPase component